MTVCRRPWCGPWGVAESPGIAGGVRQNRKGTVHHGHGVIPGSRVIREPVRPARFADFVDLSGWVEIGIGHARSLPPKQPAKKPKK